VGLTNGSCRSRASAALQLGSSCRSSSPWITSGKSSEIVRNRSFFGGSSGSKALRSQIVRCPHCCPRPTNNRPRFQSSTHFAMAARAARVSTQPITISTPVSLRLPSRRSGIPSQSSPQNRLTRFCENDRFIQSDFGSTERLSHTANPKHECELNQQHETERDTSKC
jgi:hypothetical protein